MGADEPVGPSRLKHRNRNMLIVGGLALVLFAGVILAGVIPTGDRAGTTATDPSASATPGATPSATATEDPIEEPVAVTTCADGGACAVGDIGPGDGLVFLIFGGFAYEMAPKTWNGGSEDPLLAWCPFDPDVIDAKGTAIGTGATNTEAMDPRCTSGAGRLAADYAGGGKSDWFLPSKDELNEMCNYSRNPASPPTGSCKGVQDPTFSSGTFGVASGRTIDNGGDLERYWSSSQYQVHTAWLQFFDGGFQYNDDYKGGTYRVRPVRAF